MVEFGTATTTAFTDDELRVHIRTMLMAGNETTTSLISNLVVPLAHGARRAGIAACRSTRIDAFVEECLRVDSPLTQFPRRCLAETTIDGVPVAVDEVVSLSIASANRDEAVWGDDAEDVPRRPLLRRRSPIISAFGLGAHFCVGAHLARHTARLALDALARSDDVDFVWLPTSSSTRCWFFEFWRPKRLDIRLERADE